MHFPFIADGCRATIVFGFSRRHGHGVWDPRGMADDTSSADLKLADSRTTFACISMGAVSKHHMSFTDCQKVLVIWIVLEHPHDWGLEIVMTADEGFRGMTAEVVQQMQGS